MGMGMFERLETGVHLHEGLVTLDVVLGVREHRDEEDNAIHQVAGDGHDVAGVLARETRCVPVELEVAGAAVDHPARGPAGPSAPVALFEQQDRKDAEGEVARDAGDGHATADHYHVVRAPGGASTPFSSLLRAASGTLR